MSTESILSLLDGVYVVQNIHFISHYFNVAGARIDLINS